MIRLDVPFREKDDAKALGARWNYREKYWYCEDDQVDRFLRWYIPPDDRGSSDTEVGGDKGAKAKSVPAGAGAGESASEDKLQ